MKDQDFALLLEKYLDETLDANERRTLETLVNQSAEYRQVFEQQVRQHIRLHAQLRSSDTGEAYKAAEMAVDVVERARAAEIEEHVRAGSFRDRIMAVATGLRAPRNSGSNRYARFLLSRMVGPAAASIVLGALVVALAVMVKTSGRWNASEEPPPSVMVLQSSPESVEIEPMKDEEPPRIQFVTAVGPTEPADLRTQPAFAVERALGWLAGHQAPDGSWGPQYRVGMTGLALLAFLTHGETPTSPKYGEAVRNGLRFLLQSQRNGIFLGGGADDTNQTMVYEHAVGTYAICQAYGLTQIPGLKTAMVSAVQVIIDGQNEKGGWDYGYAKGTEIDVSLSGLHLLALESARMAGAENPGLKEAVEKGIRGLQATADKGGSGLFRPGTRQKDAPADYSATAMAVFAMQWCGHAADPEARAGINALKDFTFRWSNDGSTNGDRRAMGEWPLYGWCHVTYACFLQGGGTWEKWRRQISPVLCEMQNEDGSWGPVPDSAEGDFGPVYCTVLPILMLELESPVNQLVQPPANRTHQPTAKEEPEEEISIKFG